MDSIKFYIFFVVFAIVAIGNYLLFKHRVKDRKKFFKGFEKVSSERFEGIKKYRGYRENNISSIPQNNTMRICILYNCIILLNPLSFGGYLSYRINRSDITMLKCKIISNNKYKLVIHHSKADIDNPYIVSVSSNFNKVKDILSNYDLYYIKKDY